MAKTMENEFQDLSRAKSIIEAIIKQNQKRGVNSTSLSRLFKQLRKDKYLSHFGDHLLLGQAIKIMRNHGIKVGRGDIWRALKFSKDYKNLESAKLKSEFIGSLLNLYLTK